MWFEGRKKTVGVDAEKLMKLSEDLTTANASINDAKKIILVN